MYFSRMWAGARTERTMQAVHEYNLRQAESAEITLDEWHKMMSKRGNQPIEVITEPTLSDDEIAKESARWIGEYHAKLLSGFGVTNKE